jgi:hypothetical protein
LNPVFTPTRANVSEPAALTSSTTNVAGSPQTPGRTGNGIGLGHLSLNSTSLGANLEVLATGSLDVPPPNPLSVTITSNDPTKLLLLPFATDPSGASLGVDHFTAFIPAEKGLAGDFGFPGFWIQALASSGTATITVSAPNYQSAVATVTLTPSGFVLNGPRGPGANFNASIGSDASVTVSPVQLDSFGNPLSTSQVLRGGSLVSVKVNSASASVGTILNNSAVVLPGAGTSSAVAFHPLAAGSSVLSITPPSGFTSPASGARLTATVRVPSISLNPVTVGFNQRTLGVGQLSQGPTSALNVTVTSSDPAKVLLTTDPAQIGASSVTLPVAAGATALPPFYIQALASSGAVTLTANAPGYSSGTGSVALTASAFILAGPNSTQNFVTSPISSPTTLTLAVWQLDSLSRPLAQGSLRSGLPLVAVAVSSSNTSAGTIIGSPVLFNGGDRANTTLTFQPQPNCTTPCTTTISVTQPPGYATPAKGGSMTVTVNKPNLTLLAPESTIGKNLEVLATGALDATYPQNLKVTISSSNADVLLSTTPTTQGNATLTLSLPAGSGTTGSFPDYYVQSKGISTGTAQLMATVKKLDGTDAGYNVTPVTVTFAPAGFVISGPNGVGKDVAAGLNSNINLALTAVVLDAHTMAPTQVEQMVRGGFLTPVTVTSSPAATITNSPVSIVSGKSSGTVTVHSVQSGTATISIITPTGFNQPSSGTQLGVVIN